MLTKLEDLDEVCHHALDHLLAHKKKVKRAYNKHVWSNSFSTGDLVWKVIFLNSYKNPKHSK